MPSTLDSFAASVESHATAAGGTLGLGTYYRLVIDHLKAMAVAQVDTEEERDAIKDKALALADLYVAPKFPFGWVFVRKYLDSFLDESMDNLPAFLNG